MKKLSSLVFASLLVLSAILVFKVSSVLAAEPYIAVYPPHVPAKMSPDTFTVKINVSCTTPFVGYQYYLYWNRTYINATSITETPPAAWTPFSSGAGLKWNYNATHGRIQRSVLDTHSPLVTVTGTFQVATITFKVILDSSPPTVVALDLVYANTFFSDKDGNKIMPYYVYDGDVTVTGVAPPEVKHDISIVSITTWPNAYPDRIADIKVVVKNSGTFVETFNVTSYRNSTLIDKILVTNLGVGENKIVIFHWNTSGLTPCQNWTISANATLAGDANLSDNIRVYGLVKIAMFGDVNADGIVDLLDLVEAAKAFCAIPGSWAWNPQADMWPDSYIDIYDLVAIAINFGRGTS